MTSKGDIKGLVSLKFLRPCLKLSLFGKILNAPIHFCNVFSLHIFPFYPIVRCYHYLFYMNNSIFWSCVSQFFSSGTISERQWASPAEKSWEELATLHVMLWSCSWRMSCVTVRTEVNGLRASESLRRQTWRDNLWFMPRISVWDRSAILLLVKKLDIDNSFVFPIDDNRYSTVESYLNPMLWYSWSLSMVQKFKNE
jgi:hypothetical protein